MFDLKKFPLPLKISILMLIALSVFFVVLGMYTYRANNGTSWNFGAMGMYSSSDYPGTRQAKVFIISEDNTKIFLGSRDLSIPFFVAYERFVSLPTLSNAQKLGEKIKDNLRFGSAKIKTVSVELWVLEYDKNQKTVSSKKKLEFLI